jgi:hypothetical protein
MRIALIAASAILLAGGIAAHAQTAATPGTGSGSMSNQCWDVTTNSVKQQAPGSSASGTASTGSTAGTTASPGSTTGAATSGGSASTATTRPSGMQNC